MNLGIVGSRNFTDYNSFKRAVFKVLEEWNIELKNIENIVSGGAKGADTLGEKFSKKYGLNIIIYKPNWNLHGKKAGILRNTDIVEKSTHMIAFPSKYGKGTQDSIRKAENKKIPIKVLYID